MENEVEDDGGPSGRDMPALRDFVESPPRTGIRTGEQSLEALYDVPVKVQAVLGRARMPIGDLLKLQIGTVVELDRRVGEPVDIFVNNRRIARGEVVMIENVLGVTLTEIVREES
jgi:flagellar motor switch protein FliN/FliY